MSGQRLRRCVLTVAVSLGLVVAATPLALSAQGAQGAAAPLEKRFSIGTSVQGRPIYVRHIHYPGARVKVLVIGAMHGDERAGLRVVHELRSRALPANVDLYLLRTPNPDGVAADRRTNAHHVDLNRNFPYKWHSSGKGTNTWSGPAKLSEPESRALRDYVRALNPDLVVSFHQALFGVGADSKNMPVVRALAKGMHLPVKSFNCTGVCYGTFTSWVNHRLDGFAVTVEFGAHASDKRIRRAAKTVLSVGASL